MRFADCPQDYRSSIFAVSRLQVRPYVLFDRTTTKPLLERGLQDPIRRGAGSCPLKGCRDGLHVSIERRRIDASGDNPRARGGWHVGLLGEYRQRDRIA
jgi:hypothetical protein